MSSSSELTHGELLTGKVMRVSPDGMARIRFGETDAQARGGGLFRAGQQVLAYVQKTSDKTLLSLLPSVKDGEILDGTAIRPAGPNVLARFGESELLVRVAGAKASALAAGTPIQAQLQIARGGPILQMLPSAASQASFNATVIAERGDGAALVDVDGTSFIAAIDRPAVVGELAQAQLAQLGDKWILQLLQRGDPGADTALGVSAQAELAEKIEQTLARLLAEPRYATSFKAMAAGDLRIGELIHELLPLLLQQLAAGEGRVGWISNLARALESILLSAQRGNLAQQLEVAMANSGVFLESRFLRAALSGDADAGVSGDLKLALLLAAQKLAQKPGHAGAAARGAPAASGAIAGRVGQLLDAVMAEQLHNARMIGSNEIYVQLPFARESGIESVAIRISPRGKRSSKKLDIRNILLTLAVNTSNLGRVKAALSIVDAQVSCQFRAERDSVVQFLRTNADVLKEGLEKLDYKVVCIDFALSVDKGDLSVFDQGPAQAPKGLDVRA